MKSWIILGICLLGLALQADAANRVALVVGNAQYAQQGEVLANPVNDAQLIEQRLQALGFEVERLSNLNRVDLKKAINRLGSRARGAEAAVFYYSGHGMQDKYRQGYLMPVEARIDNENDVSVYGVAQDDVKEALLEAKPRMSLIVLDACRNNPFKVGSKALNKGMSRMSVPNDVEMLVAYATQENEVAKDAAGSTRNSPYALAWAEQLAQANRVSVMGMTDAIRNRVRELTQNQQSPTRSGDMSINTYLLASLAPTPVAVPPTATSSLGKGVFKDCDQCPQMVAIPAGVFDMGSDDSEAQSAEKPVHRVTIKAFSLARYELTVGEYLSCVSAGACAEPEWREAGNDSHYQTGSDDYYRKIGDSLTEKNYPIVGVSWENAKQYVAWISRKTGKTYRLPSEAEWEYAARAGTRSKFWWGNIASHDYANYGKEECCAGLAEGKDRWINAAPPGQFPANAFGLYDMNGNVAEWVEDCQHRDYQGAPNDGRAWNEECAMSRHMVRGGMFNTPASALRSSTRMLLSSPKGKSNAVGFRLARTN